MRGARQALLAVVVVANRLVHHVAQYRRCATHTCAFTRILTLQCHVIQRRGLGVLDKTPARRGGVLRRELDSDSDTSSHET
eukprot:scaffold8850_cov134-Isochrysis_galbana.AAC.19